MKGMRQEWRKELRAIARQRREIARTYGPAEVAMNKRIAKEKKAFATFVTARCWETNRLAKREAILEGRLAS